MGQPLERAGRAGEASPDEPGDQATVPAPEPASADGAAAAAAARRRILIYGHDTLRRTAVPVAEVDDSVRRLVELLLATMHAAPGIGLAAPQIGELRRVFVVDPSKNNPSGRRLALINPEILDFAGMVEYEEGCLSVPGIYAYVRRPERIHVRYFDPDGRRHEEEYDGVMGRVIQHEYDHLDGKLFVDHLSRMRRALLMKKLRELEERSRKG
jgi:peptide deformylase